MLLWVLALLLSLLGLSTGQELLGANEEQTQLAPPIDVTVTFDSPYPTYTAGTSADFTLSGVENVVIEMVLTCPNYVSGSYPYLTPGSYSFSIDESAYGECQFDFTSEGYTIDPPSAAVTIYTPLTFSAPAPDSTFNTSSTIPYTIYDPSGRNNANVELTLTCVGLAGSGSGTVPGPISISEIASYGACITTMSTTDQFYNTSAQLSLNIDRVLNVEILSSNYYVASGSFFDIAVAAQYSEPGDTATISVICENGTFTSFDVFVNDPTNLIQMPTDVNGLCTFTASSITQYYTTGASDSLFAQANTSFISPTLQNSWTYFAGDSLINITSTYNDMPPPETNVVITCTYNDTENANTQLIVYNGVYESYNSTGYGQCSISTLFSEGSYYQNSSSVFVSRAPVTLTIPNPFYGTTFVDVLATSDIAEPYDLTLLIECFLSGQSSYTIKNNLVTTLYLAGLNPGDNCVFLTLGDTAFYASQNETRTVETPALSIEVSTVYPVAGVPLQVNLSSASLPEAILVLNCQSFDTIRTNYTVTNDWQDYSIPADYYGTCLMYGTNPTNQVVSNVVNLTVYSLLTINSPSAGTNYTYGESISVNVTAGTGNPEITVQLECPGGESAVSETKTIDALFSLTPTADMYGACTISITTAPDIYNYTNSAVGVNVYRQLVLDSPLEGASIIGGAYYNLTITTTDAVSNASVALTGSCFFGNLNQGITANTEASLAMASDVQGECTVAATTTELYYYNSTSITIIVRANVTVSVPNLESDWTYLGSNSGTITVSSGQVLSQIDGVNISCQYLGLPTYNGLFDVTDNNFTASGDTGFGLCAAETLYNSTLFQNSITLFRTRTSVGLAVLPQVFQKAGSDMQSLLELWHNSIFNQPETDIHQFVDPLTNTWRL